MRKLLAGVGVGVAVVLAGCGSSSSSGSPVSGTIAGSAFTPAEVSAVVPGQTSCVVTGTSPTPVSALAIRLATFTGVCADFAAPTCVNHRGSRDVTLIVARLGGALVGPATYDVVLDPVTGAKIIGSGGLEVALALSSRVDDSAGCQVTTSKASGTLRLDEVGGSAVKGHVDVTFQDGGKLTGDFTAAVCGAAPDVCALAAAQATCTGGPVCR